MTTDSAVIKSSNIDYEFSYSDMLLVRECVEGETAIKNSDQIKIYLPDPRYIDQTNVKLSEQARVEYQAYKDSADYDNFPESTLNSWVGLMDIDKAEFELPRSIEHLEDNADGDGLSLREMMELSASELFQMKFQGLLVEYGNEFGEFPEEQITKQQAQELGLRSSIKSYPRESIVDWDFGLVNGVKKLRFVKLKEQVTESDINKLTQQFYTNYLICALDEDGYYYQKKYYRVTGVGDSITELTESERIYPEANGQRLTELPFILMFDQQVQAGTIPRQLGALYPICRKAISMFRTSADLNGALKIVGVPTVFTKGWKQGDIDIFKQVNDGRSNIAFGTRTSNNMPNDVTVDVVQMNGTNQPLFEQMDRLQKRAKSLGAKIDTDIENSNRTATEVRAENAKETALLVNVANSIQAGYTRALTFAAMFEGDDNPDFTITLNKDFTSTKMGEEERKILNQEFLSGVYTIEQYQYLLEAGGVVPDEFFDDEVFGFESQNNAITNESVAD